MTATPAPLPHDAPSATPTGSSLRPGPAHARGPVARAVLWAGAALLTVVLVWFGTLTARGGHVFVVQTPSMARTAPVGTLVVTEKVDPSTLGKGDIITFRPPRIERTYTHRIVEVTPQGFRTKGDLNAAADGWVVPRDRVVGKATHLWFGLGWLVRMTPWLVLGGLLTALARGVATPRNRTVVEITGSALSVAVALVAVRPLVRAETIGFVPAGEHGVKISAVSTGLLPIRVSAKDGRYADLVAGQLGWIETHASDAKGRFEVIPALHLSWWGWLLFGLFCAGPLLASLVVKDVRPEDAGPADPPSSPPAAGPAPRWRRLLRPGVAVGTTVAIAAVVAPTESALTAQITNSTDTARVAPYFTCYDAMVYTNKQTNLNGELYAGWTLGDGTGVTGTHDQSTNNNGPYDLDTTTSVYTKMTPTAATDVGCQTDYTKRAQGYIRLNGSTGKVDVANSLSSVTNSSLTADPANTDRMTWIIWFRTTTTSGGVLMCPGDSGDYCADYTTWMDSAGRVSWGVGPTTLTSPKAYNDGKWHMVAAQTDSTTGMKLWVDAALVGTSTQTSGGRYYIGYPQFGYSSKKTQTSPLLSSPPPSYSFAGDLQFASMYGRGTTSGKQLTQTEITSIYESALP